jgi:putative ABC transport system ATP-binding protein
MALFALEDVTVVRAGRAVLGGLNLVLPEGVSAVVGPSGTGKSTLLRLLNRLADPQRGAVRYRDRDARALDVLALRREVGLVPQLPALLPGSVADNVRYAARLADRPADIARLLAAAALPAGLAERDATGLSVDEQQRVMLARGSPPGRGSCCSTSPPRRSTNVRARSSSARCSTCAPAATYRWSSSHTSARRPNGSPSA